MLEKRSSEQETYNENSINGIKNKSEWNITEKREYEFFKGNIKLKIELDESELSEKTKLLIEDVKKFVMDATYEFMNEFDNLLEENMANNRGITRKIFEYIKNKGLDKPEFFISAGKHASDVLKGFDIDYSFCQDDILLIFLLPKELDQYWWKGEGCSLHDYNEKHFEEDKKQIIEWKYFYRKLLPIIWEQRDAFVDNHKIWFNRINEISQHDQKKYYYIWAIKNKENKENKEKLEIVEYN